MTTSAHSKGEKVIVRFAPSPTGNLHVGSARTALFNYLFARQHGGKMVLRIEDTDRERSTKEYEQNIIDGLLWLGIDCGGISRQSERAEIYRKHLNSLIEIGAAYVSQENPAEGGGRNEVIRFKNPNKKITFTDLIRGEIEIDTTDLEDFIIAKDLENPLYHLAVVIDDFEMNITHIIRGDDGIANTPRQILIQEALGAPRPVYAHIPLILASDRSKLSKRHGAVAVTEYKTLGYLSEAMVNFLALLGWNPGTEQELFSMEDLIKEFRLEKVQKSAAIFNPKKLDWFNKQYIVRLQTSALEKMLIEAVSREIVGSSWFNEDVFKKITPLVQEKIARFEQVSNVVSELQFFFLPPEYFFEVLLPPDKTGKDGIGDKKTKTYERIAKVVTLLSSVSEENFTAEQVKSTVWEYATAEGRGNVLWPMRYALTGKEKSPDPFMVASVLGKDETISRLNTALKKLTE